MSMKEGKFQNKFLVAMVTLMVLGATFFAGMYTDFVNRPAINKILDVSGKEPSPHYSQVDFNLFWDVWSRLEDKFVDRANIDRQKYVYGAIQGAVNSLGDPYTTFFPPVQTKEFQQDIKGSFDGIGAEIGIRKGILTIIAPLKGSPAERAGLKAGDQILKINDSISSDFNLEEAVQHIRGEKGTTVRLLVMRDSFTKPKEFSVNRDTIQVVILETDRKPDGIFVIKLHQFTENAGEEFRKAVTEFQRSGSTKLVLDVRSDPGGYLNVAVDIASWFLPAGDIVVHERYANGSQDEYRSAGFGVLENVPTVVLVDGGSASASEILAGALHDQRNIKLIGQKTFGKGSVQEVENLPGGSSLKVTIAKWLTPNNAEINGKGLEPDVKVDLPPTEQQDPKKDPTLDKGIEILKSL